MTIQIYFQALWSLIFGMKDNRFYTFVINGNIMRGPRHRLIDMLDQKGENALTNEGNPHEYWQYSEYLKKITHRLENRR